MLVQGVLAILQPGIDKFSFGASTRGYMLQQTLTTQTTGTHIKRNGDALPTQASKRHRADVGNDTQLDSSTQLHEAEGQFANVVRSEIRPAQAAADLSSPSLSNKVREAESVRTKPDFQKFVSSHLKRPPVSPGGLYDMLPPEKSRQYH